MAFVYRIAIEWQICRCEMSKNVRIATEKDLESIVRIWRANSDTLGFLPIGAFQQRVDRGESLVATSNGLVVGYLTFFKNRREELRVSHLCVDESYRGKGFARQLIDCLVDSNKQAVRIRLNCRADFAEADAWKRLGFVAVGRKPGRKQSGSELIDFRKELRELPLFDAPIVDDTRALIIVDANVFLDIEDQTRPFHPESSGLVEDWLIAVANILVTDEIFNDLDRQEPSIRDRFKAQARMWDRPIVEQSALPSAHRMVRNVLGNPRNDSDRSDQYHLAIAIAAEADAFVTRDQAILDRSRELFDESGLQVGRPSEIIANIDALLNDREFQHREISRSGLRHFRPKNADEISFDLIRATDEPVKAMHARFNTAIANPMRFSVTCYETNRFKPVAISLMKHEVPNVTMVELLRVNRTLPDSRLKRSLTAYLAANSLANVLAPGVTLCQVSDDKLSADFRASLRKHGFVDCKNGPLKVSVGGICESKQIEEILQASLTQLNVVDASAWWEEFRRLQTNSDWLECEWLMHPLKVTDAEIRCYIVPIEPEWAAELFDYRLWNRPLFSPETEILISPESAYYKSSKGGPQTPTGRILWYVSGRKHGQIRACSYMTKRVTGSIKNLFRTYQRLGVFRWHDLVKRYGGAEMPATAIEFERTELFQSPVNLPRIREILKRFDKPNQQFMTATQIPASAFFEIYGERNNLTR